ncbi:MAG TPA: MATE family efflux transporter [Gemmatimonadaceae bacterium]|nr:MATE family efflux transporter [Gemmatimonadaceae bacterium]
MTHATRDDESREAIAARASAPESEMRATIRLALPVVLVQIGMMFMGVVDTVMVGHVSASVLAAVALGNLYWFNAIVLSQGTLMALDPLIAQAVGANDMDAVSRTVQRGLLIAVGLTVLTALLMLPAHGVLVLTRQQPEIIPDTTAYVRISIPSVLPFLVFIVFRQTLQALHRVAPIVWTIVGANLSNAGLNWVFVYGHLGSPALGAAGSALATLVSRWLMAIALLALAWPALRPHLAPMRRDSWRLQPIGRILRLGVPIGLQMLLESGAFGAIGLMMGRLGTTEMAGHQIAITLAALTFMVPLGVGAAAAVRVGRAVGARDQATARLAARAAFVSGMGFMSITALIFLLAPRLLAAVFTTDAGVIAIAGVLIPVAGVFQIFDGAQAVGAGVLRGLGDTRAPLIGMIAGYWLIGLPVSLVLGFHTPLRAAGLWWGFVASLGVVALFLAVRIRVLFRREVLRVAID